MTPPPHPRKTDLCALLLPAVCHYGDTGVNPTCTVGVGEHSAVTAQLGSAVAAVCHQEETKTGGNVQAQCRGEETDESSRIGKTWPASTAAQRRAPNMMECTEQEAHTFILTSGMTLGFFSAPGLFRRTKQSLCCTFWFFR